MLIVDILRKIPEIFKSSRVYITAEKSADNLIILQIILQTTSILFPRRHFALLYQNMSSFTWCLSINGFREVQRKARVVKWATRFPYGLSKPSIALRRSVDKHDSGKEIISSVIVRRDYAYGVLNIWADELIALCLKP